MIADINSFGTIIRNNKTGGPSEFVPAHGLQLEAHISKAMPTKILSEQSHLR